MKIIYQPTPKIIIEVEVRDVQEMFDKVGPLQELMESCKCGKCGGTDIRFLHREQGGFDYYELVCQERNDSGIPCGAKLSLGQDLKTKNLFPRRYAQDPSDKKKPLMKDGKKVWLPNNGWVRWNGEKYV